MFDILIRHGKLYDGSGNPWVYADVAIKGDRIVAVGALADATAREVIEARGSAVAPGFIDCHSHSDFTFFACPGADSSLHQGVTTEITGNLSPPTRQGHGAGGLPGGAPYFPLEGYPTGTFARWGSLWSTSEEPRTPVRYRPSCRGAFRGPLADHVV